MKFEVGKFYRHTTGICFAILCEAETTMYGRTLIAEQSCGMPVIVAVGSDEASAINFHEITKEEWMLSFSS